MCASEDKPVFRPSRTSRWSISTEHGQSPAHIQGGVERMVYSHVEGGIKDKKEAATRHMISHPLKPSPITVAVFTSIMNQQKGPQPRLSRRESENISGATIIRPVICTLHTSTEISAWIWCECKVLVPHLTYLKSTNSFPLTSVPLSTFSSSNIQSNSIEIIHQTKRKNLPETSPSSEIPQNGNTLAL